MLTAYLVPVAGLALGIGSDPVSALAASLASKPKTFADSNFLEVYSQPGSKPKRQSQLMEAVHAVAHGIH